MKSGLNNRPRVRRGAHLGAHVPEGLDVLRAEELAGEAEEVGHVLAPVEHLHLEAPHAIRPLSTSVLKFPSHSKKMWEVMKIHIFQSIFNEHTYSILKNISN